MSRATIVAAADAVPSEADAVAAWLDRWAGRLDYASGNLGCGCCVDVYDVEAPQEALDELPPSVLAASNWAGGL